MRARTTNRGLAPAPTKGLGTMMTKSRKLIVEVDYIGGCITVEPAAGTVQDEYYHAAANEIEAAVTDALQSGYIGGSEAHEEPSGAVTVYPKGGR